MNWKKCNEELPTGVPIGKEGARMAFEAGRLAERNRCRYPQCVENEDERCPRWLTGECEGPNDKA